MGVGGFELDLDLLKGGYGGKRESAMFIHCPLRGDSMTSICLPLKSSSLLYGCFLIISRPSRDSNISHHIFYLARMDITRW